MPTTVPSRAMKSMSSGMSVFFIQKLWFRSSSKTKSMPRPSAREVRYMSPRSRSAGVAATSSETSTAAPGPRITATGPRSRQPARASAAATAARMTRCCIGESRGLSGSMLTAILFTVCLLVGVGLFIYQVWGRFNLLRAATGIFTVDRIPERLWAVVTIALGQKKFVRPEVSWVRETLAGWLHFFVFWGFTVLGLQIVTMFGRAYSEHFYVPLMSPSLLGGPYMFVRDCFEGIVLLCVLGLMARWAITRPMRLMGFAPAENRQRGHHHWEAYLILSCIGIIVSSGPVYDASRLVLHAGEPGIAGEGAWEPLSNHVVRPLLAGMAPGFAATAGGVAWWAHNLSVLVVLNFLPLAKHFHVITSLPNVFFRKLEPLGALSKQDLENATTFGTSHIDQFTWKQVLDMFSCTECGRCSSQCPATATGKPLAPRQLLLDLRDYLYAHQDEVIEKRVLLRADGDGAEPPEVGETIVGPVIQDEVLWSCNGCRACEEACPVMIEYVDKIVDMRRHLVQE